MNKVAIAFSTRNRVELSRRSIESLLQWDKFDLFWSDGSDNEEAERLPDEIISRLTPVEDAPHVYANVRGGADAAIVFNLTTMLQHPNNYDFVGLVENDVLLHKDWFGPTFALFERGRAEGLEVGAVSARCYEDRILIQRDGYAVCHNIGAGMVIFSRKAAELVLKYFRTSWTLENRSVFCRLTDLDIARWWAFQSNEHWITCDWAFDKVLAAHGLASLALTPSPVEMIGQVPPLAEQGLKMSTGPFELLRNDDAFQKFAARTKAIRDGTLVLPPQLYDTPVAQDGTHLIFPHHLPAFGGEYSGDWKLKWSQGFGGFAWESIGATQQVGYNRGKPVEHPTIHLTAYGAVSFLVTGGANGGRVKVVDHMSKYEATPDLPPIAANGQMLQINVPALVSNRVVELTALDPGVMFYGVQTREPQNRIPQVMFDHATLPPV